MNDIKLLASNLSKAQILVTEATQQFEEASRLFWEQVFITYPEVARDEAAFDIDTLTVKPHKPTVGIST